MLNTPTINLARQQYRFYLPTFPIVGALIVWHRPGDRMGWLLCGVGVFDGVAAFGTGYTLSETLTGEATQPVIADFASNMGLSDLLKGIEQVQ